MTERIVPLEKFTDPNPDMMGVRLEFFGAAYTQAGRIDDGRRAVEAFVATGLQGTDPLWLSRVVRIAEVATVCAHRESAHVLFDVLEPFADQISADGSTTDGPVSHSLATLATTLGDYEVADGYFAQAAEFNLRAHAKFFDARTNLCWGKMLIARAAAGDIDRARTLLTAAHTAARTHGYGDIERRSAETLTNLD